jgi:hypothetical protein
MEQRHTYHSFTILFLMVWIGSTLAFTPAAPHISGFSPRPTIMQLQSLYPKLPLYMSEDSNEEKDAMTQSTEPVAVAVKCPNCDKCDGSGRILGGIPTILPWWPIKPYRPCPNFIANGGEYSRIGQPLDEIAFGRKTLEEEDDDF